MEKKKLESLYEEYGSEAELDASDAALLEKARAATQHSYSPYSGFRVGAAALLENGEILTGSNQENASFPVGLCAERVLLSAAAAQFPGLIISAMAISYDNTRGKSDHPVAPCGICRQALSEIESRAQSPVRLILGGLEGKVIVIPSAGMLLPLTFSGKELE